MNRRLTISAKVLVGYFVALLMFIIYVFFGNESSSSGIWSNMQFVSIIGVVLYIYFLLSWRSIYHRILSPYIVFVTVLYLCLCGQSIMWAFGTEAGYRDLHHWNYGFNEKDLRNALLFAYTCLSVLHATVIGSIDVKTKATKKVKNQISGQTKYIEEKNLYIVMVWFGVLLVLATIVPFIINFVQTYYLYLLSSYGSQYENVTYGISSMLGKIAEFFVVGVVTLLYAWGVKNDYNKSNFMIKAIVAYGLMAIYLISELMLGQRTGVILFSIAFLFVFFKDKKIPRKWVMFGVGAVFILMASMRMVDMLRSNAIEDFSGFIDYFSNTDNNPVIDFLGDIGWNLTTLVEFQLVIPAEKAFSYGFSYLVSLTSIVPNLNFWDIHPATEYGNISDWLRNYRGYSFGIGCTPIAEAYYNFGALGCLVFYFWGKVCIYFNRKFENKNDVLDNYQVILFMGILLKASVRSSFYAVFRPMILYVILPVVLIKYAYRQLKR